MSLSKRCSAKQGLLNTFTSFQFLPPCTESGIRGRENTFYVDSRTGFGSLSGRILHVILVTGPAYTTYTALNANKILYLKLLNLANAF